MEDAWWPFFNLYALMGVDWCIEPQAASQGLVFIPGNIDVIKNR